MKYLRLIAIAIVFVSCKKTPQQTVIQLDNPASKLGSEPNLHLTDDGTMYLSWIEAIKGKHSKLLFSTLNTQSMEWSASKQIAQGADWFVNWADFPSITSFKENSLAAHYLDKSADDTYAYDVKLILSNNNGNSWNDSYIPHKDQTNTEHGFVSKVAINDGNLLAVWLDGRKYAYHEKDTTISREMTLRGASMNEKGALLEEYELDSRVCDCCQTDSAMTQNGPIVVYRDRSDKEIRDISYVRLIDGVWTEPQSIHDDNWSIFGCPVNGPAISTMTNNIAVAWFTSANDDAKVNVAFSNNNGDSFGSPITVTQVNPLGRVDIEILKDGSALVSWLDTIEEVAVIQLQKIYPNGNKSLVVTASKSSENRSSGFPRMVVKNDKAYLAWTHSADTLTVKMAQINLKDF